MEVEVENQTVVDQGVDEHKEPYVEPVEEKTEPEVVAKSSKDLLDEVVAKVKGQAKPEEQKENKESKETKTTNQIEPQNQYTPNFKFTANKKEQEIPEYLRSVVKDKASEKQVRELCEKAFGLETVKADRDSLNKTYSEVSTKHQELLAGVAGLRNDYQRGDLDSFFQKLKIPEEVVLKYALEKAQYYNLTPEQRASIDQRKNVERQAVMLETHNSSLEATNAKAATRMKQLELDFTFMKPEASTLEKSVDAQFGKPGVLRQMVIDHGYNTWVQSQGKIDLSPAQCLQQVIDRYGLKPVGSKEATAPNTVVNNEAGETQTTVQRKVNVIPNIQGRTNTSPIKSKPKSIDDIRKLAAQM